MFVIGATQANEFVHIRKLTPDHFYLVPGVGAQGGDLETALKAGLRKDGKGMLIPVSRGVARAGKPGSAAAELRDEMLAIRSSILDNR